MEEVSRRKITNGADGGSSSSHVSAVATDDELEVIIDAGEKPSESRRIERVPLLFRKNENSKGNYDPKVVSLGPYHHGKPELQLVENIKPKIAALFVSKSGKDVDEFKKEVLLMVDDARSCYVEGSTDQYRDAKFAEMMFLDSCFVLAYIECSTNPSFDMATGYWDIIKSLGNYCSLFETDMFLLENQLPFQLLKMLMSLNFEGTDKGTIMINAYMDSHIYGDLQPHILTAGKDIEALHLLELLRKKLIDDGVIEAERITTIRGPLQYSFRSVSELKEKGIHFRPISTPYLNDIRFKSFCFYGQIQLPLIHVCEEHKILTSNLIAYELCYPCDPTVISFIAFIKSLIHHPDDVKELRSKRVLFSSLSSDAEVVKMVNDITTYTLHNSRSYGNVKQRIQDHCSSKMKIWMGELSHKYFSRPWTFIAFLAATATVFLTFVQTYCAVFPSARH